MDGIKWYKNNIYYDGDPLNIAQNSWPYYYGYLKSCAGCRESEDGCECEYECECESEEECESVYYYGCGIRYRYVN